MSTIIGNKPLGRNSPICNVFTESNISW